MEFIARAGNMMERSHRVAGLFLIISVVLMITVVTLARQTASLSAQVTRLSNERQVYVVPGSQAGFYSPTKPEMLLTNFAEYVVQSLNTYTHVNLAKQYQEVQGFFTPKMLLRADAYYNQRIRDARQDEHSALFIIDRTSIHVQKADTPPEGSPDENYYEVTMRGSRQNVIGGNVIAKTNLEIKMLMQQSFVSKENPWGFRVARYEERAIQ